MPLIPTGGLTVSTTMRELSERSGFLSLNNGGQQLRDLYVDGIMNNFNVVFSY